MRKIKLYIAASLNGFIAKSDGSVDWLESIPNPEKTDYGFSEFYQSVDTTIQGYKSYQQIIDWGIEFPYTGKKNYVLTRKHKIAENEHVEFISRNHIKFIEKLKNQSGKDIWLIGGGQVNTLLLNENLIDEFQVFIMPVMLSDGIQIFENTPDHKYLKLTGTKSFKSGVVELKYSPA